ncbi:MAG TPA: APC family permease [Gemmatimonadaceae bacterium]|nr:APC family permease [Gemmatimonadaceae bacterium]
MLRRSLSTAPLVFVMYFNISGGPFSTETLVREAGPGLALLILLLVPLVWSLPETLIVAELASALPLEGGYYRWVDRAFGRRWAFLNGWWTWLYSIVDMAIYPVLFNQYLRWFFPGLGAPFEWLVSLAVIWGATAINLRGALPVGRVSIAAGALVLGPFLLLAAAALPRMTHPPWQPFAAGDAGGIGGLGLALSVALWNYIGWDNASTVQGEVRDASRSYPRALAVALPLVMLGYFVPLLPALGATDWRGWEDGGWPAIALAAGGRFGPVLVPLVALAGMVSALALFNALLLVYSRIPLVMAEDGLLPSAIARTDRRGAPRAAVIASAVMYSLFALVSFGQLVVADVVLYALALMLEFGALIRLRVREPHLRGPFRIPAGTATVVLLSALPAAVLLLVVALNLRDPGYGAATVAAALVAAALGVPLYELAARTAHRRR